MPDRSLLHPRRPRDRRRVRVTGFWVTFGVLGARLPGRRSSRRVEQSRTGE
ncbi:hypothetical protein [Subtercola sp. RTI3]|uniref:hypothetical protein n=1 Tax=Subtercola sp. RTI3 TaxID=3048639 RepID=UPI002B224F53|nr:hypothetical protein [Subtercola sp. RTI3]